MMSRLMKRARITYPCRVCAHDCIDGQECIQCDGCQCWLHRQCIRMSIQQYVHYSQPSLQFFCRQCCYYLDGSYNFSAALSRIQSMRSPQHVNQNQAVPMRYART